MTNLLAKRFGTSPRLELLSGGWLKQGLGAKTVKFDIGQGGLPPEVNWEDKAAAIALIESCHAKALASLLVWGDNALWDWSEPFDMVVNYLAARMIARCAEDMREAPRGGKHTLDELASLVARMTLHFELYQLWTIYTVEGRLLFSGIKMNDRTYSNHFLCYQRQMLEDLEDLMRLINNDVEDYRFNLEESGEI
ncbi:hypothetical protein [Psychrobacter sp. DAB_AL43B]|uniref:hypothetical protein n=1 Tax=Psychrobacter sp. DAB_AL43B TaxID=1028416 RepID=UPI0009A88251|nr:hypothetical protein [Psychrobacter sp. DAB_AL43B]SLJ84475.1 hypothetical protein DABAL43B_1279 [Psychrobacter sp. DAB_AL43B]